MRFNPLARARKVAALLAVSFVVAGLHGAAVAQEAPAPMTEDNVITGTTDIDFATRTNLDTSGDLKPGSPALGVQDKYKVNLTVAKTTSIAGDITRHPQLYTKTLARAKQNATLGYYLSIAVMNPKDLAQRKDIGKWTGIVPVDAATGAYDLAGGKREDRQLRFVIDTAGRATGFQDAFEGRLVGKAEKKDALGAYTYKRVVGKKTVEVTVKKSDPMRFDNLTMAKGPLGIYPRTVVGGRLDYDYDTGNWLTDGITFKYNLDGKDYEDLVTGSIKWIEDPARAQNGKGRYEFNLRFNEEKNRPAAGENAAFEALAGEEAFFAVDANTPTLTGTIEYVDTFIAGGTTPSASKVAYKLNANKLTKQQVMNFAKLWLLCTSPANDE